MKRNLIGSMVALVAALLLFAPTASAQAPAPNVIPITAPATVNDVQGTFNGTLTIQRFVNQAGTLVARGTLQGQVTDILGNVQTLNATAVTLPVLSSTTAACDILNLVLGPLHLDVLGLVIDLNQVVLNVTAQPGPGNLLGNLLCAVAGLLDNPAAPAGGLAGLLNRVLGILGG